MKRIILDTSFILSCIRKKIDFFDEIAAIGLEPIVPIQVILEIKSLKKPEAKAAIAILETARFKAIDLKTKNVDDGIVKISGKNPEDIVATLDKDLQKRIKARKMIIRGAKKLEII